MSVEKPGIWFSRNATSERFRENFLETKQKSTSRNPYKPEDNSIRSAILSEHAYFINLRLQSNQGRTCVLLYQSKEMLSDMFNESIMGNVRFSFNRSITEKNRVLTEIFGIRLTCLVYPKINSIFIEFAESYKSSKNQNSAVSSYLWSPL